MYNYPVAQVLGGIAICIVGYSYFQKKKNNYLVLQIISNICFILQFVFLTAFSAMISSTISLCRTIVFYIIEKKGKKISYWCLVFFEILILIAGAFTYDNWYSIIPIIIASTYGVAMFVKDLRKTYAISLVNAILWVIYNFIIKAHVNCIGNSIEIIASLIGLIKIIKYYKTKKVIENKSNTSVKE